MYYNISGNDNVAFGGYALGGNGSGSGNTAIGANTLFNPGNGNNNVAIGYSSGLNSATGSNNITIGASSSIDVTGSSNQIRIGNQDITLATTKVSWTTSSDARYKEQIREIPFGLNFISRLRPVDYMRSNNKKEHNGAIPETLETGFIAQEVLQTLKELGYEKSGMISKDDKGYYGMRYNDLLAPMVKAIQELNETITEQKKANDEFKNQNKLLKERIEKLEKLVLKN